MKDAIKEKFVHPVILWFIGAIGVLLLLLLGGKGRIIPRNMFTPFLFLPALAYWFYFFSRAIGIHREAARGVAHITHLNKSGIYGVVRHPIYSADVVLAWGIFILWPTFSVFACAAWVTLLLRYWAWLEEKWLVRKFGHEYEAYQKTVPMFFPRFNH